MAGELIRAPAAIQIFFILLGGLVVLGKGVEGNSLVVGGIGGFIIAMGIYQSIKLIQAIQNDSDRERR